MANSVDLKQALQFMPSDLGQPHFAQICLSEYSKCPKILNTKVSDKMAYANSANPDQTAPEGAV